MIQFDSRKVKKGDIFVACKGLTVDGHDYIHDALARGAKIVYGEKNIENPKYIRVISSREKLGELARLYYKDPSSKLKIIGVTGTKGKTTTCHLVHHILTNYGKKAGLISTISAEGFHTTTHDVLSLNKELSKMVKKGCEFAVVEVSSHGISQGRISGINFHTTALTNIAPEHLDYHKTFKEYTRVKMSFVNSGKNIIIGPRTTKLNVIEGYFNNLNVETAINVCLGCGITREDSLVAVKRFKLPEGRIEEIKNKKGFRIFIDFAHTPDSMKAVLKYFKSITLGKLICVFGCAGERDNFKRPKMGKISSQYADVVIVTCEDPRSEKIKDITKQIVSGIPSSFKSIYKISDREGAITFALEKASKNDLVAILGKGHEKSMNMDGKSEIPWSDQSTVRKVLQKI